jgi:hypothetical protein
MLNNNLFHQLLYNIDHPSVQPFIVQFLSPFDSMYKMPKIVKYCLFKWCKESGIFNDLTEICLKGCKADIEEGKFDKGWKNSEMSYVVKKLESYVGMTENDQYNRALLGGPNHNPNIKSNYEAETGRMWKIWQKEWFFKPQNEGRKGWEVAEERFNMNGLDIDRIFEIDNSITKL